MLSPRSSHTDALHVGQTPAVALQNTLIGRSDDAGPGGKGFLDDGSMYTVDTREPHAVAFSAGNSGDSFGIGYSEDHTPPLRAGESGTNQVPTIAFAQNQRDELRDLGDVAGGLQAEPGMKQQTYVTRPTVRRLTPLEAERLQGFPDHWTATPHNSDSQRYKQLGNAVAVPVAEWILGNITKAAA